MISRPTSTLRGGPGTSLFTGKRSAAFHLGVSDLISWADGLANEGVGGRKSPLKREPSLANHRQNAVQELSFWEGEPIGEDGS